MKINLHSHSEYSDGCDTLLDMAAEHQRLGYSAFVVTDHCYPGMLQQDLQNDRMMTSYGKILKQKEELAQVSKKLDYPCIQGIELAVWNEEVLLFGDETIKKIYDYLENLDPAEEQKYADYKAYRQKQTHDIFKILAPEKENCAIILCHPHLHDTPKWMQKQLFELIDGYEFQNHGVYFFADESNRDILQKEPREIPGGLKNKKKFYNSDAHSVRQCSLSNGNIHNQEIENVGDLISFIKSPDETQKQPLEYFSAQKALLR